MRKIIHQIVNCNRLTILACAKGTRRARGAHPAGLAREAHVARARRRVARARRRRGVGAARDAGGCVVGGFLRVDGAGGARRARGPVEGGVEGADGARSARATKWNRISRWRRGQTDEHISSEFVFPLSIVL